MKRQWWLVMTGVWGLVVAVHAFGEVHVRLVPMPDPSPAFVWPSQVPEDCPFEPSPSFNRVFFTGRHSNYWIGDTIYPSWASDGNLYTPFTDGSVENVVSRSYPAEKATTGQAVMIGDDPMKLVIKNISPPKNASALPYRGRYPCGTLVHNGVWYYGTYCLGPGGGLWHNGFTFNWPNLGPMPGFHISYDLGKTWQAPPHSPESPLFPEPKKAYGPLKMGAPHFVDFGQNMQHSPDGKAYLLGMGAPDQDPHPRPCITRGQPGQEYQIAAQCPEPKFKKEHAIEGMEEYFAHANLSWITADQVYLARVTPSPQTINDEDAYEYFAGHDADGKPIWTDDFEKIKPLLEWNNHMGCVTATYVPQLKKYLMCVTDGWPTVATMDSYILEADELTGPWRMVAYLEDFGEQAYFLNFPSKFIGEDGKTLWLCYSANFSPKWNGVDLKFNPPGGRYGLSLHEMRLLSPDEPDPPVTRRESVDLETGNVALSAKATASSIYHTNLSPAKSVNDGIVDGWPRYDRGEWATEKEKAGAWVRLDWDQPQRIDRVILVDRPNPSDQVLSGMLVFSDGSIVRVGQPLPNDAMQGLEVRFEPKEVSWVMFVVMRTSESTFNIGLAELAVFEAGK